MSIKDYLSQSIAMPDERNPIYFFLDWEAAAQQYRLANAQGIAVINAGRSFEEEIIRKYVDKNSDKTVLHQFDILNESVIFSDLSENEHRKFGKLEREATFVLNRSNLNVEVIVRKFTPSEIPALSVDSVEATVEKDLKKIIKNPILDVNISTIWNEFIKNQSQKRRKMILNADNKTIRRLTELMNPDDSQLLDEILLSIYYNAMLYARRLDEEGMNIVHDNIVKMMERTLDYYIEQRIAESRESVLHIENCIEDTATKPEYIRIFMITPFSDEYKPVEEAVRAVFESAPFYFEVCLAKDFIHENELLENIRVHMSKAHAFIAEISDLNPNVMLELGGIIMNMDKRPVFSLRSENAKKEVPADIKSKLYIPYKTISDSVEDIKQAILENIYKDGRCKSKDIESLFSIKKANFLSKTVCSNLNTQLRGNQITVLMQNFKTVEALVNADAERVCKLTGIHKGIIEAIQSELCGVLNCE